MRDGLFSKLFLDDIDDHRTRAAPGLLQILGELLDAVLVGAKVQRWRKCAALTVINRQATAAQETKPGLPLLASAVPQISIFVMRS